MKDQSTWNIQHLLSLNSLILSDGDVRPEITFKKTIDVEKCGFSDEMD